MKKLLSLIILAPIAILLIVLSVANRHAVVFNLDPINPAQPFLAVTLPFFVFLFLALIVGMLLGSMYTWFTQSRYRRLARETKREAAKWQHEAEEQKERAMQALGSIGDKPAAGNPSQNSLSIPNRAA